MKRSLLVQFMGTALIAFVAGIAVGGYLTASQGGPSFGGFSIIHGTIMPSIHIPTISSTTNRFTAVTPIIIHRSSPTLPPATARTSGQPPANTQQGCDPSDPTCGGSQTCDPSDPSCNLAAPSQTLAMNQTIIVTQALNQTFVVTQLMPTTRVLTQSAPQPQLDFSMITIVAAIVIIAAAAGLLLGRRRAKPTSGPTSPATPTGPKAGIIYCQKCRTQNPSTNKFCQDCGTEL